MKRGVVRYISIVLLLIAITVIFAGISNAGVDSIGPQSTIVILAGIGSNPPPVDANAAQSMVFGNNYGQVNDYYNKNSFGQVSFNGRVVGPYTLPSSVCWQWEIRDEAIKAADPDVDFRQYSRLIIYHPPTSCPGTGAGGGQFGKSDYPTNDGNVRMSVSWIPVNNLASVGHELGHNLGLHHASSMVCFDCPSIELGDSWDIMSAGNSRHMNAPHKEELGWLSDNTIITTEGEYLIKPLEIKQPKGLIQQIKLPLNVLPPTYSGPYSQYPTKGFYTLEFRQPVDYDANGLDGFYSGIIIHIDLDSSGWIYQTNLVDIDQLWWTPRLQVGQTFTDSANNYKITLSSIDASGAFVKITRINSEACLAAQRQAFDTITAQMIEEIAENNMLALSGHISGAVSNQAADGIQGELNVIHTDDFEHPENSKFLFYLRSGNKTYEIQSDKQLPVVLSGTLVKVNGKVEGDKIVVDKSTARPFEIVKPAPEAAQPEAEQLELPTKEETKKFEFNINYMYIALLVLFIIGFIIYLKINKSNANKQLMKQRK